MIAYADANWVSCVDDRKSTSGGTFYLEESLVARLSNKQSSVSLSIVEVEYILDAVCCTQVVWMKQKLQDIKVNFSEPISIKCNNTSAISISKNLVLNHSKTKHIHIKYHFLIDKVVEKIVNMEYIPPKKK